MTSVQDDPVFPLCQVQTRHRGCRESRSIGRQPRPGAGPAQAGLGDDDHLDGMTGAFERFRTTTRPSARRLFPRLRSAESDSLAPCVEFPRSHVHCQGVSVRQGGFGRSRSSCSNTHAKISFPQRFLEASTPGIARVNVEVIVGFGAEVGKNIPSSRLHPSQARYILNSATEPSSVGSKAAESCGVLDPRLSSASVEGSHGGGLRPQRESRCRTKRTRWKLGLTRQNVSTVSASDHVSIPFSQTNPSRAF